MFDIVNSFLYDVPGGNDMETKYTGLKVKTFRERFSELCDSDPHNASAIAEALHVSRQTVSAWKSGFRSPKEPTIIAIAKHFQVTVPWLMGFDVEKQAAIPNREFTIFVPSPNFVKMVKYMSQEDYENVVKAFEHAYEKMKALGVSLDD